MGRTKDNWPPLAKSMLSFVCKIPLDMLSRIIHRKMRSDETIGPKRAKMMSTATHLLLPDELFVPWPVWSDCHFSRHILFDPLPTEVLEEERKLYEDFRITVMKRYHMWLQTLPPRFRDRLDIEDGPIFRYLFNFDQFSQKFKDELLSVEEEFGYARKRN